MTVAEADPRTVPGAMAESRTRSLSNGYEVTFELAPAGWLTKAGEPRQRDWRAYFITPPDSGKRVRVPSVTTLLDSICPKGGLPPWAESKGIQGAVRAMHMREITMDTHPEEAVEIVRAMRLGADAARDEAADRGVDMHLILETYLRDGKPPSIGDFPIEHHGYVQAASRWLIEAKPVPLEIEQLVCEPIFGYAGRSDLVAEIGGYRVRVDFKTSEKAGIYGSSHLQVGLYERAGVMSGDPATDFQTIVVLAANGEYRSMPSMASPIAVERALHFYEAVKPIDAACESANRAEKKARA